MPSNPSRSAQLLASQWLERSYEADGLALIDYRDRVQELGRATRLGIDSAATCTDGVVSSLRQLMASGWLNNRWRLISVDCDHFASEPWEESFACCYRNAQCLLSALFRLPDFRKRLFGALSAMPSLWKLQALLESAWTLGFDSLGAAQLAASLGSTTYRPVGSDHAQGSFDQRASEGQNLVGLVDSTAWLGASDLVSLFGSIGVRCSLLECRAPSGSNGTHPVLLEHVYSYITNGRVSSTSLESFSVPMVLQHEGHSRVVIGVEVDESEQPIALIVLDPNLPLEGMRQLSRAAQCSRMSNPNRQLMRQLSQSGSYNWMQVLGSLRVDLREVNHPQYQLLQVNGLVETELDLQDAMTPENVSVVIS